MATIDYVTTQINRALIGDVCLPNPQVENAGVLLFFGLAREEEFRFCGSGSDLINILWTAGR